MKGEKSETFNIQSANSCKFEEISTDSDHLEANSVFVDCT
jgi:hypothetical protein